jgi:hypothetical protein
MFNFSKFKQLLTSATLNLGWYNHKNQHKDILNLEIHMNFQILRTFLELIWPNSLLHRMWSHNAISANSRENRRQQNLGLGVSVAINELN